MCVYLRTMHEVCCDWSEILKCRLGLSKVTADEDRCAEAGSSLCVCSVVNPQHACAARVTVVVLCVCVFVSACPQAILAVCSIASETKVIIVLSHEFAAI